MSTRTALAIVASNPTPVRVRKPRAKPTPETVTTHLRRARNSGRVLSLDLAESARREAADALAVASLGDAVPAGIRDDARRQAAALAGFADRVSRLAR